MRSRPRSRTRRRRPREFSPSHKRNKIIAGKIGSFLGAEANKSKDENDDYKDEDDSLISGSGLKLRQIKRSEWPKVKKISHSSEAAPQTGEM